MLPAREVLGCEPVVVGDQRRGVVPRQELEADALRAPQRISIPLSVTCARAATSRSSMRGLGQAPGLCLDSRSRVEAAQVGEAPVLVLRGRQRQLCEPLRGLLACQRRHDGRRVAAVQHQRVPVGIAEERHVADRRVEGLAVEGDALRLELAARVSATSGTRSAIDAGVRRRELGADALHVEQVEADVLAELVLGEALLLAMADRIEPERLAVELLRPLHVGDRHRDEVRPLDDHARTSRPSPSIWSWIRRFISTAYSSGSSFVIGSTKPLTTIADASDSERPRDMR